MKTQHAFSVPPDENKYFISDKYQRSCFYKMLRKEEQYYREAKVSIYVIKNVS